MAQPLLNVTELDFDQIKANLKAYFQRQDSPIKDWNFDGSGLNMLLDVLAYNTHYNAILAHLNLNESFIDTAQLRSSVISQSKLLGYVPSSITAAHATVTASFASVGTPAALTTLTVPKYSKFTGTSPNGSFTFISSDSVTAYYSTSSGGYVASSVPLIQGVYRTQTYQVDNTIPNQKFVIDDPSADISTLTVGVYDHQNSGTKTQFQSITSFISENSGDLVNIKGDSKIYYLSMDNQGRYEVTFGDGILGESLKNLNVVELTYLSTQGSIANDVSSFQFADSSLVDAYGPIGDVTVSAAANSSGGTDEQTTDSIRLNAPASLISQRRAVTANDYITLLNSKYQDVSINVWGGEDEVTYDPINAAQYAGKVYVSIYPEQNSADVISYLTPYKVMSVTPVVISPDYINLYLTVNFKYSSNLTSKTAAELAALIGPDSGSVIAQYNDDSLKKFTGVFRHSNLLMQIDTADPSILNSDMQVSFYKDYTITPLTSADTVVTSGVQVIPNKLVTSFGNTLYGSNDQTAPMLTSSGFTLSTIVMPSTNTAKVTGSCLTTSTSVVVASSPGGTSTATTNSLTNPYLVVGATVTCSSAWVGSKTITSISNTGSYSIITLSGLPTTSVSSETLYVSPPSGTYYLKDGDDPASTSSRRLYISTVSSSVVAAQDPRYTSTGSDIHIGTLYPSTGKIELYRYFTGAVTSQGTTNSLNDTNSGGTGAWYTNQFVGAVLYITGGTGVGNSRVISANTGTSLTWSGSPLTLDSTSQYMVIYTSIDASTSSSMRIYARPASNDVAPNRHQLLRIDTSMVRVTATPDSFAQSGVLGANSYTTFSRDP